jgi:heat shock protein HslJ
MRHVIRWSLLALALAYPALALAQEPPPRREAPPRIGDALIGTSWQALTLGGEEVADPTQATIDFLPGDHVRGQVACNRFVAPFGSQANRITIGPVRVSRLRCAQGAALQKTLVDTLHQAEQAALSEDERGEARLELLGSDGAISRFVPRVP